MGTNSLTWSAIRRGPAWRLSPYLNVWQKKIVSSLRARLREPLGGLWLLSSGTESVDQVKAIALTFKAFEASAESANRHLESTARDRWLLALPLFHVGGLGILARAGLSGAKVFGFGKWNAAEFAGEVSEKKITLTSLVPAQVHDLAAANLRCPASLRAIVVGGGALEPDLYARARALGWPLLPSYGLTECASQVATASLRSLEKNGYPSLQLLPHVEVKTIDARLAIRADSLATWIARENRAGQFTLEDPLRGGWFWTDDLAEIRGKNLTPRGRRDDTVKVRGELVSLPQIESEARRFFARLGGELAIVARPHPRDGARLVLYTDSKSSLNQWAQELARFNGARSAPERIAQFGWLRSIPKSALGKIKKGELP